MPEKSHDKHDVSDNDAKKNAINNNQEDELYSVADDDPVLGNTGKNLSEQETHSISSDTLDQDTIAIDHEIFEQETEALMDDWVTEPFTNVEADLTGLDIIVGDYEHIYPLHKIIFKNKMNHYCSHLMKNVEAKRECISCW